MKILANKNIIVTGGSKGLGREICKKLWAQGASILAVGRDSSKLKSLVDELNSKYAADSQKIYILTCDLAEDNCAKTIYETSKNYFKQLDGIVFNAAIQGPIGPSWENDTQELHNTVRVNLLAPIEITKIFVPDLITINRGSLIYLSGGGAAGPRPRFSAYAVAKTGLVRFVETLAAELANSKLDVNAIAPGAMPTDMLKEIIQIGIDSAGNKEVELAKKCFESNHQVMERTCDLVSFLISDISRGISGRLISAQWDNWENWPEHVSELQSSDLYTLRRIVGSDRGKSWGDK